MPRIARVVVPGLPHHITQRGNYGQNIFQNDSDREKYLSLLKEYSSKFKTSFLAYCLMSNHVHFIAIPEKEDSLAKTFNASSMLYSQYFNKKNKVSGHLWKDRFYSCVLDEPHLVLATRYVERNPVRVNVVKKPWQWQWSSALTHIGKVKSTFLKLINLFDFVDMSCDMWKDYIDTNEDDRTKQLIKKHTLTGRPLGDEAFIETLEKKLSRRLHILPKGRPAKRRK